MSHSWSLIYGTLLKHIYIYIYNILYIIYVICYMLYILYICLFVLFCLGRPNSSNNFSSCHITVKKSLHMIVVPWSVIILKYFLDIFHKYALRKINLARAQASAFWHQEALVSKDWKIVLCISDVQPHAMPNLLSQPLETRALFCSRTSKQWPGLAHSLNCMFLWGKMEKPLSLCI